MATLIVFTGAQVMAGRRRSSSDDKPEKSWVTSGEVARALNMTDAAIRRWAREGLVESIKTPGGQYRFRREAVSNLMKARYGPKVVRTKSRAVR
jgi:excisionase family DNA binding protein